MNTKQTNLNFLNLLYQFTKQMTYKLGISFQMNLSDNET